MLKKIASIIGVLTALCTLCFWVTLLAKDISSSTVQNILDYNYSIEYSGVVVEKYVDFKNHAYNKIVLTSGDEVVIPTGETHLFELIQVGDSMQKYKESFYGVYISDSIRNVIDYETWLRKNFKDEL